MGNAGSITIEAGNTVSFDRSNASTSVDIEGVGNGGDLNITTRSLFLTNGAHLEVLTRGQGDGGNITINANTLEAVNGAQVVSTSYSSSKAGNITLNVTESVPLLAVIPPILLGLPNLVRILLVMQALIVACLPIHLKIPQVRGGT